MFLSFHCVYSGKHATEKYTVVRKDELFGLSRHRITGLYAICVPYEAIISVQHILYDRPISW